MKRAIPTLVMVLTPVGFVGLTGAMAAPSRAPCRASGYTNHIGAPGSCPTMSVVGANTPTVIGAAGF